MDSWRARFLGLRHLPREVTAFEVEVSFQFSAEEARIIDLPRLRAHASPQRYAASPRSCAASEAQSAGPAYLS
jgi:hypothetical protein